MGKDRRLRPDALYDRPDERAQTGAGDNGGALAFLGGLFEPSQGRGDKFLKFGRRHRELAVCAFADEGIGEFETPVITAATPVAASVGG